MEELIKLFGDSRALRLSRKTDKQLMCFAKKWQLNPFLTKEDIISAKQKHINPDLLFNKVSGLYFLINDSDIVYIGKSIDILSRILTHTRESKKNFNSFSYIAIPEDSLADYENPYIAKFQPKYNSFDSLIHYPYASLMIKAIYNNGVNLINVIEKYIECRNLQK